MSPEEQKDSQNINNVQPNLQPQAPLTTIEKVDTGHGLGIASLITSFFVGIVGIILGIIGLNKSKKAGCKNGLAIAGIIIGAIQTAAVIAALFISVFTTFLFFNTVSNIQDSSNSSSDNSNVSQPKIILSKAWKGVYVLDDDTWDMVLFSEHNSTNVPMTQTNDFVYANGKYVMVSGNSEGIIFTSTDAINWDSQIIEGVKTLDGIAYGNNIYVAIGSSDGTILTSNDGISWKK